MNIKSPEVLVIGGGIIGTSTAYYLSRKGVRVMLIEAGDIAGGTSGSCDRAIMIQSKSPGPLLELALESARIYKSLENELGEDLEYSSSGGMIIIENEDEMKVMEHLVTAQQASGIKVRIIGRDEAVERQPLLSPHILGATCWDGDADVNPICVCLAMARAARLHGAEIILNNRVNGLLAKDGRVVGVNTACGDIKAEKTILAAGIWTPEIGKTVGLNIPVIPRKGQIIVTERLAPVIRGNILSGNYIACKHNPELAKKASGIVQKLGVGLSIGQTRNGNLLIGGTREFAGHDLSISTDAIKAIAENAVRLFPSLRNVHLIRSFAGLRPYSPDGRPFIGPIDGKPGLYIAAGHEGDGIALGPITGRIMADIVMGSSPGCDITPFSPERFKELYVS
ncbi:MAG: NAD(P)/FAD-dependent oxidoreductase [Bacillota bacterium]